MQSVYFTTPADWATGHSLWGILTVCRDAVDVSHCLIRRGHRTRVVGDHTRLQRCSTCILQPHLTGPQDTRCGECFLSVETQSEYSTALSNWATRTLVFFVGWGDHLTLLQRNSRYILQPNPTDDVVYVEKERKMLITCLVNWVNEHKMYKRPGTSLDRWCRENHTKIWYLTILQNSIQKNHIPRESSEKNFWDFEI